MRICLFSKDAELQRQCREVLESFPDREITFIAGEEAGFAGACKLPTNGGNGAAADLHVIDFTPGQELPSGIYGGELHKCILVAGRNDMNALRKTVMRLPLAVLLKPISRARLEIAFEQAFSQTSMACPRVLRADEDNLLQYLLQANVRLQEYDQDRTNFIGRAVHEFRAPLTSINGYCGLLLSGTLGALSSEQRNVIDQMQHSVSRLSRLTATLFDLSVGDRIDRTPNLKKGDIIACTERALDTIGPLCQNRNISLDWQYDPPTGDIYFASDQMEQVLVNLLENSCRFSPRGGQIQVRACPDFWERRSSQSWPPGGVERRRQTGRAANAFRVAIADNGPGIPTEHVKTVFEEYTRYSGGEDRSGAGLGLAICQAILRMHHGRIWAESSRAGARFFFVLPYGLPAADGNVPAGYRAAAAAESKMISTF